MAMPLYTVTCKSARGELLMMNELEFYKRIKQNVKSVRVLEDNCEQKATALQALLKNNRSYYNHESAIKEM
jgi:hypothetical protein